MTGCAVRGFGGNGAASAMIASDVPAAAKPALTGEDATSEGAREGEDTGAQDEGAAPASPSGQVGQ